MHFPRSTTERMRYCVVTGCSQSWVLVNRQCVCSVGSAAGSVAGCLHAGGSIASSHILRCLKLTSYLVENPLRLVEFEPPIAAAVMGCLYSPVEINLRFGGMHSLQLQGVTMKKQAEGAKSSTAKT
jgi:hypothetical protein